MSRASRVVIMLVGCLTVLSLTSAWAHKASDAYLWVSTTDVAQAREARQAGSADARAEARVATAVRYDIALRDLDLLIDLDADRDGRITWGELQARKPEFDALVGQTIVFASQAGVCSMTSPTLAVAEHSDGRYAVVRALLACPDDAAIEVAHAPVRSLDYTLLRDVDPTHRVLVRTGERLAVIAPGAGPTTLSLTTPSLSRPSEAGVWAFLRLGMHHILIGWDHLAFLVLLLLPVVLRSDVPQRSIPEASAWTPAWRCALTVLARVTAFTLAHSITLALSAFGVFAPSSRWVESLIAVSIVAAGLLNLNQKWNRFGTALAFGFGLVHGFGFASVLRDSGAAGATLVWNLLAFNAGVEIGQIAFVLLIAPLLWMLRNSPVYAARALPAGSLALAALGLLWLIERVFDVPVF